MDGGGASSEGVAGRRVGGRCGAPRLVRGWRVGRRMALFGEAHARAPANFWCKRAFGGEWRNEKNATFHNSLAFSAFLQKHDHSHSPFQNLGHGVWRSHVQRRRLSAWVRVFFFEAAAALLPSCLPAPGLFRPSFSTARTSNSHASDPGPRACVRRGRGNGRGARGAAQRFVQIAGRTVFSPCLPCLFPPPPARPPPPRPAPRR